MRYKRNILLFSCLFSLLKSEDNKKSNLEIQGIVADTLEIYVPLLIDCAQKVSTQNIFTVFLLYFGENAFAYRKQVILTTPKV